MDINYPRTVLIGYYFGNKGFYAKCGQFFDRFLFFCFGEVDFQREPYVRNKIDYLARIFMPSIFLVIIIIYCLVVIVL